jgi:hypothetical protein
MAGRNEALGDRAAHAPQSYEAGFHTFFLLE